MEPQDQIFPHYQNANQPNGTPPLVPPPSPDPLPPKNKGRSILGTNLLILAIYFVGFIVFAKVSSGNDASGIFMMGYLWTYLGHAGILILFTIIRVFQGKNSEAGSYLLTAILIPLIGFGACTVVAMSGIVRMGL